MQDGVPETIQLLKLGNIKVWVLTGDKQGQWRQPTHFSFSPSQGQRVDETLGGGNNQALLLPLIYNSMSHRSCHPWETEAGEAICMLA